MKLRARLGSMLKTLVGRYPKPPDEPWHWVDPPDEEFALVPTRPRKPLLSDGIELPLPRDD